MKTAIPPQNGCILAGRGPVTWDNRDPLPCDHGHRNETEDVEDHATETARPCRCAAGCRPQPGNLAELLGVDRTTIQRWETGETAPQPGARGVVMSHISHAYPDGASLYFTYVFPRLPGGEIAQWRTIKQAASEAIASHGGTISHHHGVGEDHLPWIAQEKGALGIEIYRAIKRTLDPSGILNPGKLIPP